MIKNNLVILTGMNAYDENNIFIIYFSSSLSQQQFIDCSYFTSVG